MQGAGRKILPYICDVGAFLEQAQKDGKHILFEAQLGALRDIDYGIFPYTSSSSTISSYATIGAGLLNAHLDHVAGVLKAYSTCVGARTICGRAGNGRNMDGGAAQVGR